MIRSLIWDAGGTLFDTYPAVARSFQRVLQTLGYSVSHERLLSLCRHSIDHCMTTLSQDLGIEEVRLREDFWACYGAVSSEVQEPFPGVVDLCAWVHTHGGQNFVITHRGRDSLLDLLHTHGMSDYFTDWITADDDYPRKPDPTTFEVLVQRHHLDRQATLAIGDREIDMVAAQAAALRTCFFGDEPLSVPVDFAITDFAQLKAILSRVWDD